MCLGLGVPLEFEFATDPLSVVGPVFVRGDDEFEDGGTRLTTVFTLDELGVGESGFGSRCTPFVPASPLSDDVVDPELTPLEL